jgi:hypothetical protein
MIVIFNCYLGVNVLFVFRLNICLCLLMVLK